MIWDWSFAVSILPDLLQGLKLTVIITAFGTLIAMLLGLVFALIRRSRVPLVSRFTGLLLEFIRGTPLLVQAYFAFYVLPAYGLRFSALTTGIIVIGINYSSYTAEVYRAGIDNVARGQWEAATALSLSARRKWQGVILPQAIRAVVPALGNYVISMFKDSAVLSAITVLELLGRATVIGSSTFRYLEPLTIAGLLFLLVSYVAAMFIRRLENRLA
jgi:polar amino acid transport system permease protein